MSRVLSPDMAAEGETSRDVTAQHGMGSTARRDGLRMRGAAAPMSKQTWTEPELSRRQCPRLMIIWRPGCVDLLAESSVRGGSRDGSRIGRHEPHIL